MPLTITAPTEDHHPQVPQPHLPHTRNPPPPAGPRRTVTSTPTLEHAMPLFVFTVIAAIATFVDGGRSRMQQLRRNDQGDVPQWVVITGIGITLAVLVGGAITAFVTGHLGQIK